MLKIYKDGDQFGIATDSTSREDFFDELASELEGLVQSGQFENDLEFQFRGLLPYIVSIGSALPAERGDDPSTFSFSKSGSVRGEPLDFTKALSRKRA